MAPIKIILYALAIVSCVGCTALLLREYLRTRVRLLLWSTLCFVGLSVNNILLFIDLVVYPSGDLRVLRLVASLTAMLFLLYGFIWETKS